MTSSERGGADDITENPKECEGTRLKSDGERGCNMQQNKCVRRPSAWARRAWAVAKAWFEKYATQAGPRGRGKRTLPTQASWWLVALDCGVRRLAADRNRNPETMTQSQNRSTRHRSVLDAITKNAPWNAHRHTARCDVVDMDGYQCSCMSCGVRELSQRCA